MTETWIRVTTPVRARTRAEALDVPLQLTRYGDIERTDAAVLQAKIGRAIDPEAPPEVRVHYDPTTRHLSVEWHDGWSFTSDFSEAALDLWNRRHGERGR